MLDFQKKIKFLLKNLYNNELNKLTEAFISFSPLKDKSTQLRSRKVTIRKWIDEKNKINTPHKFQKDYQNYTISQLKFRDGREVFSFRAFDDWSLDKFEDRFREYTEDTKSKYISLEHYQYIYYYYEKSKSLAYIKINYEESNQVTFVTNHSLHTLTYKGEVKISNNTINFIVSNESEMMFFSFSELDLKLNNEIYGIYLSKDFSLEKPKSSLVLLSRKKLKLEMEGQFKTKINPSNITIAKNNKRIRTEESSFIDNLSIHLKDLKNCTDNHISKDIFLNIFLEEFNLFYRKFSDFDSKNEFFISSLINNLYIILNSLEKTKEKQHLKIIYTLKNVNNSLFSLIDNQAIEIYTYLVKLSKQGIISFEFIIALDKKVKVNKELEFLFKGLEEAGICILFRDYSEMKAYTTILLIDNYNLAISCRNGYYAHNITRSKDKVADLRKEYEIQKKHAQPLQTILDRDYPLNGTWYMYGNGSNNTLHFATILIEGDSMDITLNSHDNKRYKGVIHRVYGDVLLCTNLAIMKFKEDKKKQVIKIISLMSDQHNGNGEPVILFAILSRVEMEEDDREMLFSALVDRESSPYDKASFKLSLTIHNVLRPLLFKYEAIYNS